MLAFDEYLVIPPLLSLMDRQGNKYYQKHILFNIKLVSNNLVSAQLVQIICMDAI